jgi:hypothetical protein
MRMWKLMVITLGKQNGEVWHLPFSQVPPVFGEAYSAAADAEVGDFIAPLSFFKDRLFIIDALIEFMPYFAGRPYIHPVPFHEKHIENGCGFAQ